MADDNIIRQGLGTVAANRTLEAMQKATEMEETELRTAQDISKDVFLKHVTEGENPFKKVRSHRKSMLERKEYVRRGERSQDKKDTGVDQQKMKQSAEQAERKNAELKSKMLLALRQNLNPKDTREDILRKVTAFYEDPALADEALEFLEETSTGDLKEQVKNAKSDLNTRFSREIAAGRNVGAKAREFAAKGLGTPSALRDLYRDITGNPRDSVTLFQELANKYNYKDLKDVIKFMFHSLGTDLRSKGPSIPKGQLFRLMTETRNLQAIMGVYRFFNARMRLINSLFAKNGLTAPKDLTFELISKQFMALVGERYPTPDKALDTAKRLGLEEWILAKIIVLCQMRDAIRELALLQIFGTLQHRDDLLMAILEALENLEDALDEENEEEDEDDEEDEDKDTDDIEETT